jgi:hypothetical protein
VWARRKEEDWAERRLLGGVLDEPRTKEAGVALKDDAGQQQGAAGLAGGRAGGRARARSWWE